MSNFGSEYDSCELIEVLKFETDCCIKDNNTLICGPWENQDNNPFYAHILIGLTTLFHAIHTIPMWASVCERNAQDCN